MRPDKQLHVLSKTKFENRPSVAKFQIGIASRSPQVEIVLLLDHLLNELWSKHQRCDRSSNRATGRSVGFLTS